MNVGAILIVRGGRKKDKTATALSPKRRTHHEGAEVDVVDELPKRAPRAPYVKVLPSLRSDKLSTAMGENHATTYEARS